jgi:hypothetical protein
LVRLVVRRSHLSAFFLPLCVTRKVLLLTALFADHASSRYIGCFRAG